MPQGAECCRVGLMSCRDSQCPGATVCVLPLQAECGCFVPNAAATGRVLPQRAECHSSAAAAGRVLPRRARYKVTPRLAVYCHDGQSAAASGRDLARRTESCHEGR